MAALAHRNLRLYWSSDVIGTQVGGTVKNVLAIAAGIVEGREFSPERACRGHDARVCRIVRLGTKLGGRFETLTGLSGLGDLILTCSSIQSRNMSLASLWGRDKRLQISSARGNRSPRAFIQLVPWSRWRKSTASKCRFAKPSIMS